MHIYTYIFTVFGWKLVSHFIFQVWKGDSGLFAELDNLIAKVTSLADVSKPVLWIRFSRNKIKVRS